MSLLITGTIGFGIGVALGIVDGYLNSKLDKEEKLRINFKQETTEYFKNRLNLYTEEEIHRLMEKEKEYNSKKAAIIVGIQSMIQKNESEIKDGKWLKADFSNAETCVSSIKKHITNTTYSVTDWRGKSIEMTDVELDPYLDSIIRRNYTLSTRLEKILDIYSFIDGEISNVSYKKCVPEWFNTDNSSVVN